RGELLEVVEQRPTTITPDGRRARGGPVKSRQKGGQVVGRLRSICGGSKIGGRARQPGGDDPGAWKALRGFLQAERDRNPQRKTWGKDGEPGVFLAQQRVRELGCLGQPDSEVIAAAAQLVVPTSGSETRRVRRQVRVLVEQ